MERSPSRWLIRGAWLCALLSVLAMARTLPTAADAGTYATAIGDVRSGASPYVAGLARIKRDHAARQRHRTLNYIYPPATLPLLRVLRDVPPKFLAWLYWLAYGVSLWAVLWLERALLPPGRKGWPFLLLTPFTIFFPGLLFDDSILSGNVAPLLYAFIGLGIGWGLRKHGWSGFYAAVLLASLVKPTMLTLLIIPPFAARRERLRATVVAVAGCVVLPLSAAVWPELTGQYRHLMARELLWNDEFGASLPGQAGKLLLTQDLPFRAVAFLLWLGIAAAIVFTLWRCSLLAFAGRVPRERYLCVLLLGAVMLNPRVMQYDAGAVTLLLALVLVQVCRAWAPNPPWAAAALAAGIWGGANLLVAVSGSWYAVEAFVLPGLFAAAAAQMLLERYVTADQPRGAGPLAERCLR